MFSKNPQISNFTKISSVGAELFYAEDGQTDRRTGMTKLLVAFCNFSNAPKTVSTWSYARYYLMFMGAFVSPLVSPFVSPYSGGLQPAVWL
jgi:hypothetical protein